MNTYTWKINALDCYTKQDDLTDVVYNVHWTFIGENPDGVSDYIIGVQSVGSPSADSFTDFDSLDLDTVVSWISSKMDIDTMKANIDKKIEEKVNPTTVTKTLPVTETPQ